MSNEKLYRRAVRLLISLVVVLIGSLNLGGTTDRVSAADWELIHSEGYPWTGNDYGQYPIGIDKSTNQIVFSKSRIQYTPGYSYQATSYGGFQPMGPYFSLETLDVNLVGGWFQPFTSGGQYSVNIYRKPYDSSFSVWDAWDTTMNYGTTMMWGVEGTWGYKVQMGYTDIVVDRNSQSVSVAGDYKILGPNTPVLYMPGGWWGGVEKYEYSTRSGMPVIDVYGSRWENGSYWDKRNYIGKLIAPKGTYPASGTYTFGTRDSGTLYTQLVNETYDVEPPTVTITPDTTDWTKDRYNLNVNAVDNIGVVSVEVQHPNSYSWSPVYDGKLSITVNGVYKIRAMDAIGNVGYGEYRVDNLDTSSPSLSVGTSTSEWTGRLSLTWAAADTQSGLNRLDISSGFGTKYSSYGSVSITENGTYTLTAYDNVGNSTTQQITITNIDKTPPELSLRTNRTDMTNGNVWIIIDSSDSQAGIDYLEFPDGSRNSSASTSYMVTENGNYTVKAVDKAGNVTSKVISVSNIDKEPPRIISLSIKSNGTDSKYAKYGDNFIVTATFSEPILTTSGTVKLVIGENDTKFTPYGTAPNTYTLTGHFYAGSLDAFINSLDSVANISDQVGNYATLRNVNTTDGSYIQYYGTGPSAVVTDITASNANPGYARVGSVVNVTWQSNQHLLNIPSVTLHGKPATTVLVSKNVGGPAIWKSTVTIGADAEQGELKIKIGSLLNQVGMREPLK